jgi:DNA-binding winged helix-turn-helix (wHTH) protein
MVPMHTLPSGRVLFGAFEVDLSTGELRSTETPDPNNKVLLREQVFQILRMLLEREGKIVTREEIKSRLWANDTIVDFDHSINATIKALRRALGDSADNPRYIETLGRRGYRLLPAIEYQESGPGTDSEKDGEQREQSAIDVSENAARVQEKVQGKVQRRTKPSRVENCGCACVGRHFGGHGLYLLAALSGYHPAKIRENHARGAAL